MDYLNRQQDRFDERAKELVGNLNTIEYGAERHKQIKTELGMIALEMACRQIESQGYDPAAALAMLDVEYFGFTAPAKGLSMGVVEIGIN